MVVLAATILLGSVIGAIGGFEFVGRQIMAWFDVAYYPKTVGLPLEHYHRVIQGMLADIRMNVDALVSPITALPPRIVGRP